jgi:hypothetical protein
MIGGFVPASRQQRLLLRDSRQTSHHDGMTNVIDPDSSAQ